MVGRVVSMTPRTNGKVKTIQVIRDSKPDPSEVYHEGNGHLNGIIINKESSKPDPTADAQEMQLEFTCLMHNSRTEEGHAVSFTCQFIPLLTQQSFTCAGLHNIVKQNSYILTIVLVSYNMLYLCHLGFQVEAD